MIFCPKREQLLTEDAADILDGILPEAADVYVLDLSNVKYNGSLCRLDQPAIGREGRVAVKLLIEQTRILVPRKAVLHGATRDTLLALGIKVMLPLIKTETGRFNGRGLAIVNLAKAEFDAHMAKLIADIVQTNALHDSYAVGMDAALARLPHRLKADLFIVCGTIADNELFRRLEANADKQIEAFRVKRVPSEACPFA